MTRKDKTIITSILGPGKLPGPAQRVLSAAEEGGTTLDNAVKLYELAGEPYAPIVKILEAARRYRITTKVGDRDVLGGDIPRGHGYFVQHLAGGDVPDKSGESTLCQFKGCSTTTTHRVTRVH